MENRNDVCTEKETFYLQRIRKRKQRKFYNDKSTNLIIRYWLQNIYKNKYHENSKD